MNSVYDLVLRGFRVNSCNYCPIMLISIILAA